MRRLLSALLELFTKRDKSIVAHHEAHREQILLISPSNSSLIVLNSLPVLHLRRQAGSEILLQVSVYVIIVVLVLVALLGLSVRKELSFLAFFLVESVSLNFW